MEKDCKCGHVADLHKHYTNNTYCSSKGCTCGAYLRKFLWFWI